MIEITFLGAGGGRFVTITQVRSTGGFFIKASKNIFVDPGPGALVRMIRYKLDPRKIDVLFISHRHTDHCNDAEVIVEGMTYGVTKKRGTLIGSRSVVYGDEDHTPALSKYHLEALEEVHAPNPGDRFRLGNEEMIITPSQHSDPTTIGFRLKTSLGDISYIADTEYFPELVSWHDGSRVLIASVTRPRDMKIPYHLSTDDIVYMLKAMKQRPEVLVMTHLGMKMHFAGPYKEAQYIQNVTGVKTYVAKEGFRVTIDKEIKVKTLRPARFV
ncbi:MBL fold metallo-hydrolase [Pyrococcus abyssi]|uniref:Metal dependent hydrolase n=1 Tax=Pyrococcus abyssi (strain GE5 / Orsay) TaxID=272844 RepID=Q9UXY8_PYRAB|nr:MBL fold metallo-hydrolase [Pyrococcus abyssi]CAB50624.1 Metal dependent hydrolase [Pyrococcus abyssi GE5]CCE71191.1 TPA: metal dependent hydrolase [Pyrococcus abyssi GE5]